MVSMRALRLPAPISLGRILGIPIMLDWSWVPMIPIYAWGIAGVYLPHEAPNRSLATYWALGLVATVLLVASVVAHELAHALVARAEGVEIEDITVHMFGGMARLKSEPPTPSAELKIAVVGPGASFALGVFFLLLNTFLLYGTTYVAEGRVLRHLGIVNLVLATFNLLPGFPLDGGRALRAVLWHRRGDAESALRTAKAAGHSIGISLLAVGLYVYLTSDEFTGLSSISIGALMLLALMASDRRPMRRARGATTADVMRRPPVTVAPGTTVERLVDDVLPIHKQAAFLVAQDGRLHGVLALESIRDLPRDAWPRTTVSSVMRPVDDSLFVPATAPAAEAARLVETNGVGCAAVLDADGLVVGDLGRDETARGSR
jgi:Zn-dependent protease/CBS domain-containing protein